MLAALQGKNMLIYPHGRIIHILFHEQVACRRFMKWKKVYLSSVKNMAMWFHHSQTGSETMCLLF